MCIFKRRKAPGVTYSDDRKTILLASQEIDVLIVLDENKFYLDKLKELQDVLKFLSPRENQEVYEMDLKIKDKIGDLKLMLNKDNDIKDESVDKIISNIFVMIQEREAKELK